jgi:hypothetical protein
MNHEIRWNQWCLFPARTVICIWIAAEAAPPEVYEALLKGTTRYRQEAFFPTPALLSGPLRRPCLDYPSVAPPVRIFARNDVLVRHEHTPPRSCPFAKASLISCRACGCC